MGKQSDLGKQINRNNNDFHRILERIAHWHAIQNQENQNLTLHDRIDQHVRIMSALNRVKHEGEDSSDEEILPETLDPLHQHEFDEEITDGFETDTSSDFDHSDMPPLLLEPFDEFQWEANNNDKIEIQENSEEIGFVRNWLQLVIACCSLLLLVAACCSLLELVIASCRLL